MKIKITSSANGLWYKDKMGQEFDVVDFVYEWVKRPNDKGSIELYPELAAYVVRGDDSLGAYKLLNIVYPEHCEVLSD